MNQYDPNQAGMHPGASPVPEQPRGRSIGKIVLFAVLTVAFGVFTAAGVVVSSEDLRKEQAIKDDGKLIDAKVTEMRTTEAARRGTLISNDLKYKFDTAEATGYGYEVGDGGKDDWASLPEDDWNESKKTGIVKVRYLEDDPWKNRPDAMDVDAGNWFASIVLGLVSGGLTLACLWAFIRAVRGS